MLSTGMRYTILALTLLALACSKKEAPPQAAEAPPAESSPSTEGEAKASPGAKARPKPPELPPETRPVVALISAGAPPLQEIRRRFEAGAKERLEVHDQETIEMKGAGWDSLYHPRAIVQRIGVETKTVSPEGVAEVALEVREAKEIEASVEAPNARMMNATGVSGTYTIDARGLVSDLRLIPPAAGKVRAAHLDAMRSRLRWMAPPFPEEPIGVGAKWSVTGVANEYQAQMNEEMSVELLGRTASEIVLRFEIKSSGTVRHDFEVQPQTISYQIETRGEAKLDPSKLVPRSSTLESTMVQAVTLIGVEEPPEGSLKVTTVHTAHFKKLRK